MDVQRGKNHIFMNVQRSKNYIFMNESGAQGALHGVSTDELSHFLGASTAFYTFFLIITHTKQGAVHFLGIPDKRSHPFLQTLKIERKK